MAMTDELARMLAEQHIIICIGFGMLIFLVIAAFMELFR